MSLQNSGQVSDVKVLLKVGADGAGIDSIEKTSTSGNVDTYTITYTDGRKTTFDVTNGSNIEDIEKTSTVGYVDTYTVTLTDGTTTTFEVVNGITDLYTPQMYGAVGDGVTDDSDAFIDLFTNRHEILIPSGRYLITKRINVNSNTTILCNGIVLDRYVSNDYGLFHIDSQSDIYINGLNVEGSGCNHNANYDGEGFITIVNSNNIVIDGGTFKNTQKAFCIWPTHSHYITIKNCTASNCAYGCIALNNDCSHSVIDGCHFENFGNTESNQGYGVSISGYNYSGAPTVRPSDIKCVNNTIINSMDIWCGIDSHGCDNAIISNNIVFGGRDCIVASVKETSEPDVNNLTISDNIIVGDSTNNDLAIRVTHHNNVSISNNVIQKICTRNTSYESSGAIDIRNSHNVDINNNLICDCGNSSSNKLSALFYAEESDHFNIEYNKIKDCVCTNVVYALICGDYYNINNNFGNVTSASNLLRDVKDGIPMDNTFNYCINNKINGADAFNPSGYCVVSPAGKHLYPTTIKSGVAGDMVTINNAGSGEACMYLCTSGKSGTTDAVWTPIVKVP